MSEPNTLSKSKLQFYKGLKLKKNRHKYDLHIAEGLKLVLGLCLDHPKMVESIICTKEILMFHRDTLEAADSPIHLADAQAMKAISQFKNPSRILAVCHPPQEISLDRLGDSVLLYLNGIQDPGNVGTILRTADWFGLDAVVLDNGCADLLNGKTIQASMGSYASIPYCKSDLSEICSRFPKLPIYLMDLGGTDLHVMRENVFSRAVFVLGSEGQGISDDIKALPHRKVHINGTKNKTAESLNVASAAAILCNAIYLNRLKQFF